MFGFLITVNCSCSGKLLEQARHISCDNIHFYYSPLPKFQDDKLFYEDDEKILLLDGVIYNKIELMDCHHKNTWREAVDELYHKDTKTFFNEFRGSFSGAVFMKSTRVLLCFVSQSGEKPVYYTQQSGFTIISSHNNILTEALQEMNFPVEPNVESCRELLYCASILHGKTPFKGVFRLTAGKYLLLSEGKCEEYRYHMFRNIPEHNCTLEECVEELDKRFRKAVDRIFSKNREYGYQAECDLSGGLDSRLVTWVAHDLGYRDILNICYCQSGNIDHTTSQKIARDLGNEYFFISLDGGHYLMDIDERINLLGGQISFVSSSGSLWAAKEIARRNIGLSAMGLLGELHNAYWTEGTTHTPAGYTKNRYSSVISFEPNQEFSQEYDNFEQMNLYEYSALLFLSSSFMRQQTCEVASPYIDVDYLEYAYRVPLKWRKDYLLTKTWMVTKYPAAAKYVWQTMRMPVDKSYYHQIYWPKVAADSKRLIVRCINKIGRVLNLPVQVAVDSDMLPFDVWYRTDKELHQYIDGYFTENIDLVADALLKNDIKMTFEKGNTRDKLQAINVLGIYKRYF